MLAEVKPPTGVLVERWMRNRDGRGKMQNEDRPLTVRRPINERMDSTRRRFLFFFPSPNLARLAPAGDLFLRGGEIGHFCGNCRGMHYKRDGGKGRERNENDVKQIYRK